MASYEHKAVYGGTVKTEGPLHSGNQGWRLETLDELLARVDREYGMAGWRVTAYAINDQAIVPRQMVILVREIDWRDRAKR